MIAVLKRASVFLLLLIPSAAFAASVSQVLTTPDDQAVSRGDFLRASMQLLKMDTSWRGTLPYKRPVPTALKPYVGKAYQEGALKTFGTDLAPARSITRGEVAEVLVALQKLTPKTTSATFTDVTAGSDREKAVRVMVEKEWMHPQRANFFGAESTISGRDARVLLQRIFGTSADERASTGQSITIQLRGAPVSSALPKQDLLQTIWQLLNKQYLYSEKLDGEAAAYKAAQALVQSLKDPYTSFLPPTNAQEFRTQLEGEVTGIGAQVEFKDEVLTIVSPLPGSPAEKAGLKPLDQIIKVDGVTLTGLDFIESVAKVRGPKGSTAKLTIRRNGGEVEIEVIRDTIKVPEIDITWQGTIAVVRIVQFGQRTENELRSLLQGIQAKNPTGLILDLRNNPGGLLDAADIAVSNFLPKGSTVARIVSRDEDQKEVTRDEPTIATSVPMVVLINKGSASASEIVAAALQDAKRAKIVGEQSFGKGTVQQVVEFKDGSSLKMTIAEWLSPAGRKIQEKGVMPDLVVAASEGRDEQLLKALDILR